MLIEQDVSFAFALSSRVCDVQGKIISERTAEQLLNNEK
jgi:ABC-type branched-subunit amino acid transport system ATPase component